jgi:hypothetical protein
MHRKKQVISAIPVNQLDVISLSTEEQSSSEENRFDAPSGLGNEVDEGREPISCGKSIDGGVKDIPALSQEF